MAVKFRRYCSSMGKLFLLVFLSSMEWKICASSTGIPSKAEIVEWAGSLDRELTTILEKISGIDILQKEYSDLQQATLIPVKGAEIAKGMAAELNLFLQKKMDSLQRLVTAAEEAVFKYKYDQSLPIATVKWVNVKNISENETRLEYSEKFLKGVNYNSSGVHIPVEIYEGYPEILNGLKWSSALDKAFKDNTEQDPDILWQYYGSQAGFMRTYPATKWDALKPDLFDVRRRPWYIHGSSSPKDMLILMDVSGSMHGQTMEIMKIAVKTLLNTLGEDDFVNVAWFSNDASWVSCFDTFVQATRRNKVTLNRGIDALSVEKMASLVLGLNFSFIQFEKFQDNREKYVGADCHKVIVIFSDGGTEEAKDLLKKLNRDRKIRIFTFAVGPHPVPFATLKAVACRNKGYFSCIPSMGAIRSRVQDYVKVLSRPMVLSDEKQFQWTNFYTDISGLGVLTTITLPVFNRSDPMNQSIAGVMGLDVTVKELIDFEQQYQLGPGGYTFAINHNGLVVFHPDLPEPVSNILSTGSPDPPHTDFLDVEVENDARNMIRTNMIDRKTGSMSVTGIIELQDMKHAVNQSLKYYYTPIEKTDFTLGVVVMENHTHYIGLKNIYPTKGLGLSTGEDGIFIAPWKYCYNTVVMGNISIIIKNITNALKNDIRLCDQLLIERLIWDIDRTRSVVKFWEEQAKSEKRDDVLATFVSTEGGLTRVYPTSEMERISQYTDPRNGLYYKRALYSEDYTILLPEINSQSLNHSETVMTFVKMLVHMEKGFHYRPAVVGGVITSNILKKILLQTPKDDNSKFRCGQTETVLCYIVDDGGFIILSNQHDDDVVPGRFLGDIDPELMQDLFFNNIYNRVERYNHEALCDRGKKSNAATRSISPLNAFKLIGSLDAYSWLWEMFIFFSSWFWSETSAFSDYAVEDEKKVCSKLMARYYIDEKINFAGNVTCSDYVRQYSVASVGQTNLLLLVSNRISNCAVEKPVQQPRTISDNDTDLCNPVVRYRRRPGKCYAHHPQENTSLCHSGTGTIYLNLLVFSTEIISTVFLCQRIFK